MQGELHGAKPAEEGKKTPLPKAYGMVVRRIKDLDRPYAMYEAGDKSVFAVLSKERARDCYMRP